MSEVDKELNNAQTLPFSERPQQAVLGLILTDKTFFLFCKDKIEGKFFLNTLNSKIYTAIQGFYNKFNEYPSIETLLEWPAISTEDVAIKNRIELQIKLCLASTRDYNKAWITDRISEWIQTHAFTASMERAALLYNRGDFAGAFDAARTGVRKVDDLAIETNQEYNPDLWQADFAEAELELKDALTFGNSIVDSKLNSMTKSGSLLLGDTTILLASTNVGKTTALITILCHNLLKGKDILFLTHEGRPQDLMNKIWMNLLGLNRSQLFNFVAQAGSDPSVKETIDGLTGLLRKHLCWIPMNGAGLTVEEVNAVIRRKFEEKVHRDGKGYDMICDDYPAKLSTVRNSMGKLEKRHEDKIVYSYFVQLALEFKCHSLLALQANREASRINRGQNSATRLLTPEDASEAFAPCMEATNILSLNRDDTAMAKKLLTYYICKSRSNETGFAIVCRSNYEKAMTHSDELGATWYRGTARLTDSERIDDFLTQFKGSGIPESAMIEPSEGKKK